MEFVSRTHTQRSAQYSRPANQQPSRPAALTPAFRRQIDGCASSVLTNDTKAASAIAGAPAPSMQVTDTPPRLEAISIEPEQTAAEVINTEVPAYDTSTVAAPFESIQLETLPTPQSTVMTRKSETYEAANKKVSIKKRTFSAAVFAAAFIGMVAMGYDLFVAPHPKPEVSVTYNTVR